MRSKSNKTMAQATATLVMQFTISSNPGDLGTVVQQAVDRIGVLRRTADVEVAVSNDALTELRCRVEYGPVFGCYESDLRRQLQALLHSVKLDVVDSAVFHFQRREVSPSQLPALIDSFVSRSNDVTLSLSARKTAEVTAERLRNPLSVNAGGENAG